MSLHAWLGPPLEATGDVPEREGGGGALMCCLADELNTGGLVASVAARHAAEDQARMAELDRLIADGHGSTDPRHLPKPAAPEPAAPTETTMADRIQTCGTCGKTGHNARGCSKASPSEDAPSPAKASKPRAPKASRSRRAMVELDVDELLELRREVDEELRARKEAAQEQLSKLTAAIDAA